MDNNFDEMKLYKLAELESIFGVTHRTLLSYIYKKTLPAIKVGGFWRVKGQDVANFLNATTPNNSETLIADYRRLSEEEQERAREFIYKLANGKKPKIAFEESFQC